ncbi:MAG: DUF4160 domain-containing protein [Mesorhizobium sp.]|nr:DUF4160 domain-containing protein [Mesorhizobium sp.]
MPTISIFFGVVVQMYWNDHNPPHFHAFYQGSRALIAIGTGEIIAGSLPPGVRRILRDWTLLHHAELMANWERGMLQEPFQSVPGADEA